MTQTPTFRVDTDPWIPVVYSDGRFTTVGLRTLFTDAHLIHSIAGPGWSPLALSALYRILAAITYRVTGLLPETGLTTRNADQWEQQWRDAAAAGHFAPHAIDDYFDRYAHRWGLTDLDHPWLQDPRLGRADPDAGTPTDVKDLNQIFSHDPSDNGPVFRGDISATNPREATPEETLPELLATLYFHSGSRTSTRVADGNTGNSAGGSPLRGTLSLHPTGMNLHATLLAHLVYPRHPEIPEPAAPATLDLAPWETSEPTNPGQPFPPLAGIITTLTNRARRDYLLTSDPATGLITGVRRAPRYTVRVKPEPDADIRDPYIAYRPSTNTANDSAWVPLQGDVNRHPWRDVDSLLSAAQQDIDTNFISPLAVRDGQKRWGSVGKIVGAVIGHDADRSKDLEKGAYASELPAGSIPDNWGHLPGLLTAARTYKTTHAALRKALNGISSNQTGAGTVRSGENQYWHAAAHEFTRNAAAYLTGEKSAARDAARIAYTCFDDTVHKKARDARNQFLVANERRKLTQTLHVRTTP